MDALRSWFSGEGREIGRYATSDRTVSVSDSPLHVSAVDFFSLELHIHSPSHVVFIL